jgi:hypothetical protein
LGGNLIAPELEWIYTQTFWSRHSELYAHNYTAVLYLLQHWQS